MRSGSFHTTILRTAVLLLPVLLGIGPALAAPGKYHEDERVGFKVKTPRGWTQAALNADEEWIVLKYISDKEHIYIDATDKSTWTHRPDMTVVTFIDEVVKKDGVDVTKDDDGGVIFEFNNPYKSYKDYLKRRYRGGGWFISSEEESEVNSVPVTQYEIKVEKLTMSGPKRIVTWVYHFDDVDIAVQFEVLENAYGKLKRDVQGCLKSFKKIPRTKGSLTPAVTGGTKKFVNESKMTPEERKLHRQETEQQIHRKNVKSLPDGWKVKEMGRFLVLIHGNEKYAKEVVKNTEAIWKWLDKNFASIGTGEYVRRPIIRICKDRNERNAFFSGTTWGSGVEIVTFEDKETGSMSREFEYINRRMLSIWFNHRARDVYWAMPHWMDLGLAETLAKAKPKGSKLEFKIDEWERDGLRESARNDQLTAPKTLVMLGRSDFGDNPHRIKQSTAFIRFLLGSKAKKTKSILFDYIENLQDILNEQKDAEKGKDGEEYKPAETEEEEEARFAARRSAMKEREAEFLQAVFDRTFGDWSDKDWKKIKAQYFKSI